jgi:chromosome transmission fidelity protein 8
VFLKIGQHELKGSVVTIEKPLAVLKKLKPDSSTMMDVENDDNSSETVSSTSYEVVGVVRQKFLFKDRPKVLLEVSNSL